MKTSIAILISVIVTASMATAGTYFAMNGGSSGNELWEVYDECFVDAKYVDLTHAFSPTIPVWAGFGHAKFKPCACGQEIPGYAELGEEFTYEKHGFIATAYELSTDQYGTQLDPPAHFNPRGATIDKLPSTYCIRPLVVINISDKVKDNPGYHCSVEDVKAWEKKYGEIPEGAVVMIRSDWSKRWSTNDFLSFPFPGITLDALKYLHEERHILFHGHEPLDTDTTPEMVGEAWLLHHNYCQAEGVANLDKVPESGALIAIGFAKPEGGTGGYARYIAICPPDWKYGTSIKETPGVPLPEAKEIHTRDEHGVLIDIKVQGGILLQNLT